jgi:hypothetical protein
LVWVERVEDPGDGV